MADETAPRARRRAPLWIAAIVLIVATGAVLVVNRREPPQPPAEVWVPATSFDKLGARPMGVWALDVRTSPSGPKFTGWRGTWSRSDHEHRPYLGVYPEQTWTERVHLRIAGAVTNEYIGGYADSGERREADGVAWARMTWLDAQGVQDFFNDK